MFTLSRYDPPRGEIHMHSRTTLADAQYDVENTGPGHYALTEGFQWQGPEQRGEPGVWTLYIPELHTCYIITKRSR